ncbi:hypothetical protein K458DRAFT_42131 [Lentithecium fluviatile CBS 122367]|uniref:Uncharacterized protein n=1 Tax=Lentithecium fluviatile CBS 122367 TaxID=1168545 RepID=A0A6G1IZQ9_9PLEO|nr:hypothetical protein K458DRAFT_42131 [Lentithecium fluviatile CBS 122367]
MRTFADREQHRCSEEDGLDCIDEEGGAAVESGGQVATVDGFAFAGSDNARLMLDYLDIRQTEQTVKLPAVSACRLPTLQAILWREWPREAAQRQAHEPEGSGVSEAQFANGMFTVVGILAENCVFILHDCMGTEWTCELCNYVRPGGHQISLEPLLDWATLTPVESPDFINREVLVFQRDNNARLEHGADFRKHLPPKTLTICPECLVRLWESRIEAWSFVDKNPDIFGKYLQVSTTHQIWRDYKRYIIKAKNCFFEEADLAEIRSFADNFTTRSEAQPRSTAHNTFCDCGRQLEAAEKVLRGVISEDSDVLMEFDGSDEESDRTPFGLDGAWSPKPRRVASDSKAGEALLFHKKRSCCESTMYRQGFGRTTSSFTASKLPTTFAHDVRPTQPTKFTTLDYGQLFPYRPQYVHLPVSKPNQPTRALLAPAPRNGPNRRKTFPRHLQHLRRREVPKRPRWYPKWRPADIRVQAGHHVLSAADGRPWSHSH